MIQAAQHSAMMALNAFSTKVQANANNIANVNTAGYKKTEVTLASVPPNGVKANSQKVNTAGPLALQDTSNGTKEVEMSNVDLGQEIPEMNTNSLMYQANLKTLKTSDQMIGSLLNIKG